MKKEGGYGHWVVLVIGIILILFVIGFFKAGNSISNWSYKAILRLPCGLTVEAPKDSAKANFPLTVNGYVNGCGWGMADGTAGTVQVFDGNGTPLTKDMPLIVPPDSTGMPYYFEATLPLITPPRTDTGSVIFHGLNNFMHAVPITF